MSMFHLGWFLGPGATLQGWGEPGFSRGYSWDKPDLFQDMTRALERACFDLLILEDSSAVPYTYQGSMDYYLRNAVTTPKFDPAVLTSYLAAVTKHIGLVPTLTTTFYPPWILARALSTMDHYSGGRIGWNIVTAASDAAAQNFGHDKQFEHDLRYDMADEFVDLACRLWDAWEPDAVVDDEANGVFIDPSKVKALHFEGRFYKSRGPLNVPRSPQGRPLFIAPGGSPRGRKFSGRNVDVVLANGANVAEMKDYRDEVLKHALAFGRDPSKIKTLFICMPTVVKNSREAEEFKDTAAKMQEHRLEHGLAGLSSLSGIDFSKYDVDGPVGEIKTNGMQTILRTFQKFGPHATLRQILTTPIESFSMMVGTADHIAGQMKEAMDEIGGDGFLVSGHMKPQYVTSIVDELVPVLQKRGLTRTEYGFAHLRDNVMAF